MTSLSLKNCLEKSFKIFSYFFKVWYIVIPWLNWICVSRQVNLVSEHIWCDDFLVRSFYLKNMQTNETRTVTQFHFLTWLNQNVPETSRTLLDFRR